MFDVWIDILVDEISAVAMLCHADLADHALRVMQAYSVIDDFALIYLFCAAFTGKEVSVTQDHAITGELIAAVIDISCSLRQFPAIAVFALDMIADALDLPCGLDGQAVVVAQFSNDSAHSLFKIALRRSKEQHIVGISHIMPDVWNTLAAPGLEKRLHDKMIKWLQEVV